MGLFDSMICRLPLPVEGANALEFQTKSFDMPFQDRYEIREDGSLWHEDYDTEDHSDPKAEGFRAIISCMTRVNQRWVQVSMTGEIRFYKLLGKDYSGWMEFSAYLENGRVVRLNLVAHWPATEDART